MLIIDYIVAGLLLVAFVRGIVNGLLKEIASLLAIILGIVVARIFMPEVAIYLQNWFEIQPNIAQISAFALIFVLVALGLHLVAYMLKKFLELLKLGFLNRLLGGLFGVVKMALILSLLFNLLANFETYFVLIKPEIKEKSVFYPHLEKIAEKTLPFLQEKIKPAGEKNAVKL